MKVNSLTENIGRDLERRGLHFEEYPLLGMEMEEPKVKAELPEKLE